MAAICEELKADVQNDVTFDFNQYNRACGRKMAISVAGNR
jgi:hypothetical protein